MEREEIRSLLSKATKHRPAADIAREVNLPTQNLYDFMSRGVLGRQKLASVERWLISHGFIQEQRHSINEVLAKEFELAASILRSESYDSEEKEKILDRIMEVVPKLRGK